MTSPLESPITADAPPLISPSTSSVPLNCNLAESSSSLGLRITVDLSENVSSANQQDDFLVNRLLADDDDAADEELLAADDKTADSDKTTQHLEVRFVDNSGFFKDDSSSQQNILVTRDKRYINRSATSFVTGIDRTTEEWKQRRLHRGSRFGTFTSDDVQMSAGEIIQDLPFQEDFDVSALYESVGLTPELLTKEAGNLRLNAIHVRGLDDFSTEDIMKYFGAFFPTHLEWIDDSSCNVVWQDETLAARALWALSKANDEKEEIVEGKDGETHSKMDIGESPPKEAGEKSEIDPDKSGDVITASGADEEHLSAAESDDVATEERLKSLGVSKMYADREPGETSSGSDDEDFGASGPKQRKTSDDQGMVQASVQGLKWRIGTWQGRESKGRRLFMRFTTVYDKKQAGANKYSKYYEKYGNPNYNNMPGLISASMRRRLAGTKRREQLEEARAALKALGGGKRDADAAMSELEAMGAGTAVGEDDDEVVTASESLDTFKNTSDLRSSGYISSTNRVPFSRPSALMRMTDGSDRPPSPEPHRQARGRVGSSEGRCPPPSPRYKKNRHRTTESGEDWVSSEDSSRSSDSEYSTDDDDPINELLSAIPVRGRGSTRSKLYADEEERKRSRGNGDHHRASKMRSDRTSRSRSRSPVRSYWTQSSKTRRNLDRDDRDDNYTRSRSLRDRLGPQVLAGSGSSSRKVSRQREEPDRHRHRRRDDMRSRLG